MSLNKSVKIIKTNNDTVDFETISVLKITDYPLEKRDYKPYAQLRVALSEKSLFLELLSFEANPNKKSCLSFCIKPLKSEKAVYLKAFADKKLSASIVSKDSSYSPYLGNVRAHFYDGDDLQGVFWGLDVEVSLLDLEKALGASVGDKFEGGFFKTCEQEPWKHYGSLFPCDWNDFNPLGGLSLFEAIYL